MIRNKEFALEIFLSVLILLVFTLLSFFRPSPFLLPSAATLIILNHFIYTKRRYSAIKRLTDEITNVLHGYSASPRFGNLEGEISILEAEIGKMAGRLLESAEKLAADKRFLSDALSDISHQLRTPLTAMNLTLSLLSEEAVSPERREALIRELLRSLKKIDWLIEALLKMSRLDAGAVRFDIKPQPVKAIVEKAAAPLEIFMEIREVAFRTDFHNETVACDLFWTAKAVSNLIKNCAQHTPPGGTVTISAKDTPIYCEITVSDTGEGFSKDDLPHLFERFYKGKHASEDSIGIGLSLSKNIFARQNGTIKAVNTPSGASFIVRFYKTCV